MHDELSPEELRRHTQRLAVATRAAGVGIWERDLSGRLTYWDDQMYRLRGLDPANPPSAEWLALAAMRRDDYAEMMHLTQQHIERGEPYRREFRVTWPDGSEHWLASAGMVVRDGNGSPLRMTGASWDVTQRRIAEAALREKEAAERASRAKSEFMARMSHELRTPLNAVLGFSQLMANDAASALEPVQAERLARIRSAGRHLLALIDDVLDISAIEAGTLPMNVKPVSLDATLDDVVRALADSAGGDGIHPVVEPTQGWVLADERRLRQVFMHLVAHAIKGNGGNCRVVVAAKACRDDGRDGWEVSIRDCGRGLTAEQQRQLFEPFSRRNVDRGGADEIGIGLTMVRHLVGFMGGRIEIASAPDIGTEFRVQLPASQPPVQAQSGPVAEPRKAGPLAVLYIEDNPVNVLLVQQMLQQRPNVSLRCAEDGSSGIAMALASAPDVLLVDMHLPDMDGVEVLRRLRRWPALAHSSFIALTASAMAEDVAAARAAGFHDYWTKPVDMNRFLAGIDRLAIRDATPQPA
jgi:PAS domain S-box-containing protein